jgi:hypothetical protein
MFFSSLRCQCFSRWASDLPSRESMTQLVQRVQRSFWLTAHTMLTTSTKTRLLPHRVMVDHDYQTELHVHVNNKLFSYFSLIRVPSHRLDLAASVHALYYRLTIEVLRWTRSGAHYISDEWRLCRFYQSDVEDMVHAFVICEASPDLLTVMPDQNFARTYLSLTPIYDV